MNSVGSQHGFILAVVLWTLAALTIIAGTISAQINSAIDQATQMEVIAERERDRFATEQTLLFLISGLPMNAAGVDLTPPSLEEVDEIDPLSLDSEGVDTSPTLRLDGSVYDGIGDITFAFSDPSIAFSLRSDYQPDWTEQLRVLGADSRVAGRIFDEAKDYQDADDFHSLNGAEASEYEKLERAPPRNRIMMSPFELKNLPVSQARPDLIARLIDIAEPAGGFGVNLNTSSAEQLSAAFGWSATEARDFVSRRQSYILSGQETTGALTGTLVQRADIVARPGDAVRIMLGADGRQHEWINVRFTPNGDGAPWIVEYHHPVDLPFRNVQSGTNAADGILQSDAQARPATSWPRYRTYFPAELSVDG